MAISHTDNPHLRAFQRFLANTRDESRGLSNAFDFWEAVPKYSISQQAMNKQRTRDGVLQPYIREFMYDKALWQATVYPVSLIEEGKRKDYYPSANEEIVESCLLKLASAKDAHLDYDRRSMIVRFSLYELREELKRIGHSRSYPEVVKSLSILAGSQIVIERGNNQAEIRAAYFPVMSRVSKSDQLADADSKWTVQFHPLVTREVLSVQYRQYDYATVMSYKSQLARWLHKKLAREYINASMTIPSNQTALEIQRDSGLLDASRMTHAVQKLDIALEELKEKNVIRDYSKSPVRGARRTLLDVEYSLKAHGNFIKHIKAASKRQKDDRQLLKADRLKE